MIQRYAIGLGSNRRHGRHGAPAVILRAAIDAMNKTGIRPVKISRIIASAPFGPSARRFANAVALVQTSLAPPALLVMLKALERQFGRRRGRRWGERVLDLDILLWSGGSWSNRGLTVPHPRLAERLFVLGPLVDIAPDWRVPGSFTVRQLAARLTRRRPVHRSGRRSGP